MKEKVLNTNTEKIKNICEEQIKLYEDELERIFRKYEKKK